MRQRTLLTRKALSCIAVAVGALALLAATTAASQAETKPPSAFAPQAPASPGATPGPPSAFSSPSGVPGRSDGVLGWVLKTQQSLQRDLATSVKNLKGENAVAGAVMLAALSFLYGVVHAVGPGHGKAIISSYVVANEKTVRRGIVLSFVAAGLQALTAIALVGVLAFALNATGLEINAWSNQLESVSYALIALVGLWLLTTQLSRLYRGWRQGAVAPHDHRHHEHDHHHAYAADRHGHAHPHDHDHAEDEACSHMVDASTLAGPFSWRKAMAVVFSVGVRPCTGAILVLIFALTQGLFWAGVAATFAMAFGTALTVAALASLALGSRELALKLGGTSGAWANGVWTACAIGGSALILVLGTAMFAASLGPARPF